MSLAALFLFCFSLLPDFSGSEQAVDSTAAKFVESGFLNVRSKENEQYRIFTLENDYHSIPVEGMRQARKIIGSQPGNKDVKLIFTRLGLPELTMTYSSATQSWHSTKAIDGSWREVRNQPNTNSNIGKVSILVYHQMGIRNFIINQVYHFMWQLAPAVEVSLWKGMKFSAQIKLPIYNDGYPAAESKISPTMITLSQSFRLPFDWSLYGKFTLGTFSAGNYGTALDLIYYFPNERFFLSGQLSALSTYSWNGFKPSFSTDFQVRWKAAANYFCTPLQTQFMLGVQKFLLGDVGLQYEMIRHFNHTSVSLYAVKAKDIPLNVGFRFSFTLPPFKTKRHGYLPKVSTSTAMSLTYNANNERSGYKEFRVEASDNIMSSNFYNPYFVEWQLK